jgi:alpha-tubulin suppressor-like RCC1 family protein
MIISEVKDKIRLGGKAIQVAAGGNHTCALMEKRGVRCWGNGATGYHGSWGEISEATLQRLGDVGIGAPVKQIVAGSAHTCALLVSGDVKCWGKNDGGQLGYPGIKEVDMPAEVGSVRIGGRVARLAAGAEQTCALLETGRLRCWGSNRFGQLGYGHKKDIGDDETPESAGDVPVF